MDNPHRGGWQVPCPFSDVIDRHMNHCKESLRRIEEGVDLVCSDPDVRAAFQFANKTIHQQISGPPVGASRGDRSN